MPEDSKTLQPVVVENIPDSAPVNPPVRVTTNVDAVNRAAQVVDGRIRVSDDISDQAVEAGHQPDIQPRSAVPGIGMSTGVGDSLGGQIGTTVYPDTTAGEVQALRDQGDDAKADDIVNKAAASVAAFEQVTSPLSMKTEVLATQLVEDGFTAPEPSSDAPPTGGPVEQIPLEHTDGSVVQGSGALTGAPVEPEPTPAVENPGLPPSVDDDPPTGEANPADLPVVDNPTTDGA